MFFYASLCQSCVPSVKILNRLQQFLVGDLRSPVTNDSVTYADAPGGCMPHFVDPLYTEFLIYVWHKVS